MCGPAWSCVPTFNEWRLRCGCEDLAGPSRWCKGVSIVCTEPSHSRLAQTAQSMCDCVWRKAAEMSMWRHYHACSLSLSLCKIFSIYYDGYDVLIRGSPFMIMNILYISCLFFSLYKARNIAYYCISSIVWYNIKHQMSTVKILNKNKIIII